MVDDEATVRPETRALEHLIRRTVGHVLRSASAKPADAMLFLGNRHDAFPSLLVQDPVLEPVDKVVWMVVCQLGQASGAAFPRYEEIARLANIASTSTVSRAIAILRATRWLSLCVRVRDGGGRFRGNVYALHDEPLPLPDTLHLDTGYMDFVQAARQHHHARVRKVADAVLASLDEDVASGRDLVAPINPMARRSEASQAVERPGSKRYFDFSATVMARLTNRSTSGATGDQAQKSKPDRLRNSCPQKSKSVRSSCINNKTTTTQIPRATEPDVDGVLIYPQRLSANQRAIAARYLERVPFPQRQQVLDELEGRLRAERQGAKPVYDELRYLYRLCSQIATGGFQPNLCLKVERERVERAKADEARRHAARVREEEQRRRGERRHEQRGESPLAEARRILGRSAKASKPRPK
jgi:hypothetical protein